MISIKKNWKILIRFKNRFFANVSHEIRTPLTLINVSLFQIQKYQKLNKAGQEDLQQALRNVSLLEKQLQQILMLSKVEAGKILLNSQAFLLLPFLEKLMNNFSQFAQQKKTGADTRTQFDW